MSYYNFNDHFWSPQQVCVQSAKLNPEDNFRQVSFTSILFIIFISIWSGILIKIFIEISNKQFNMGKLNTGSSLNNCLMLKSENSNQIYCAKFPGE